MEEQDYPLPRDIIEALAACESSDSIERELQSWGLPRAIQHWSRKACETWLQAYLEDESYLNVEIPQPKADPEDFFNTYIRVQWGLFDQVLLRSSKIGIEVQLAKNEVISNLIIWGHVVIHPPRRFLVPTFLEWIDMDFVPALATYHDQFFRSQPHKNVLLPATSC